MALPDTDHSYNETVHRYAWQLAGMLKQAKHMQPGWVSKLSGKNSAPWNVLLDQFSQWRNDMIDEVEDYHHRYPQTEISETSRTNAATVGLDVHQPDDRIRLTLAEITTEGLRQTAAELESTMAYFPLYQKISNAAQQRDMRVHLAQSRKASATAFQALVNITTDHSQKGKA